MINILAISSLAEMTPGEQLPASPTGSGFIGWLVDLILVEVPPTVRSDFVDGNVPEVSIVPCNDLEGPLVVFDPQ